MTTLLGQISLNFKWGMYLHRLPIFEFQKLILFARSCLLVLIVSCFDSGYAYGNKSNLDPYGFLLPQVTVSSAPADTFGYSNSAAPTGANQKNNSEPYQRTMSFQTQQSRIGFNINLDDQTKGKLELDFFSSAKSSPTVSAQPRLRIARITTQLPSNIQIAMGQDWDYFSPLGPHTYNFIGNGFMSGNIGFMRHLLGLKNLTDGEEWALGIGLPVANDSSNYSNVEYSYSPNISANWSMFAGANKVGFSLLYAQLIANNDKAKFTEAGGFSGHLEHTWKDYNLRAEVYRGANLGNLGTFGISQGRFINDSWNNLREFGFHPSGNRLEIHAGTWKTRIEWLKANPSPDVEIFV